MSVRDDFEAAEHTAWWAFFEELEKVEQAKKAQADHDAKMNAVAAALAREHG